MGLSIKKAETEEAVRQLATLTGEGLTEAIHRAVVHRIKGLGHEFKSKAERDAERDAFFAELDARPILAPRPWREIEAELYDENGAPR